MNKEIHQKICVTNKVRVPFEVKVEWYTGHTTIETVLAEDDKNFYFDFKKNNSWYAPIEHCERTTDEYIGLKNGKIKLF